MITTMTTTVRSNRKTGMRQRGIAAVEFAIVLPLLLLLMLATAEFGRAFFQYNALTKAVRDGARYISQGNALSGTTGVVDISAQARTNTKNVVVYGVAGGAGSALLPGFTTANVSVVDAGLNNIRVSAAYAYQPMLGITLPSFCLGMGCAPSLSLTLRSTVMMKAL